MMVSDHDETLHAAHLPSTTYTQQPEPPTLIPRAIARRKLPYFPGYTRLVKSDTKYQPRNPSRLNSVEFGESQSMPVAIPIMMRCRTDSPLASPEEEEEYFDSRSRMMFMTLKRAGLKVNDSFDEWNY